MKHNPARLLLPVLTLAALVLTSCGANAKAASINQLAPEVNTAVAATLTALPTNTPVPSSTPTLAPTPTAIPMATATSTVTPVPVYIYPTPALGTVCYNTAYVADVTIPDNTQVAPGKTFRKTWLLENTGTCTWHQNFKMGFVGGYDLPAKPRKLGQVVKPGEETYLTVVFTAPDVAGQYISYWRLGTRKDALFGETVSVVIDVPNNLIIGRK
jgi:hypothetical protein